MTETWKLRRPYRFALIGVALAVGAAAVALYGKGPQAGKGGDCPAPSVETAARLAPLATGEVAAVNVAQPPTMEGALAFQGPNGAKLTLADFKGRAVLLNLWATWCVPCRAEMPTLDHLQAEAGDKDFEVVAVNVDTARLDRPNAFLDQIGVRALARYADPSADTFETLRVAGKALGLPASLLIDADGCEIAAIGGPAKWDSPDALAMIKALKGS